MKSGQLEQVKCPKCHGSLFLDRDRYGWYEQCLQCGYEKSLDWTNELPGKVERRLSSPLEPALARVRK
jgi:hypothetical protein